MTADLSPIERAAIEAAAARQAATDLAVQIEAVSADRRKDKKQYFAMLATILACALFVVGGGTWYVVDSRGARASAAADRATTNEVVQRIDSCVVATGKCYKEQQARANGFFKVRGPLSTQIVLALACFQNSSDEEQIFRCVEDKLEKRAP